MGGGREEQRDREKQGERREEGARETELRLVARAKLSSALRRPCSAP